MPSAGASRKIFRSCQAQLIFRELGFKVLKERLVHSVRQRESGCKPIMPFAGGENGSLQLRSKSPGNNCSSSDASLGTRNSGEENEEMGTIARPASDDQPG